jgi:hypothetical protein
LLTTNACSWPELSAYNPPALQVPAEAHDTVRTDAVPPVFRATQETFLHSA